MIQVETIDVNIVKRYLGIKSDEPNEVMDDLINEAISMIKKDSDVTYVCGIYDIVPKEGGIGFDECAIVLPGEDIKKHLEGAEKGILMAATLSASIDTRIRSLQIKNMPLALVYDAVASVAIDSVCDSIQEYVQSKLPDYIQTSRFSPGYGDLPLEIQPEFLKVIEATKRAGISVTEGNMLTPTKSITAVIGLKNISKYMDGSISAVIPDKAGCGTESVCSKCKAGKSCSMSPLNK